MEEDIESFEKRNERLASASVEKALSVETDLLAQIQSKMFERRGDFARIRLEQSKAIGQYNRFSAYRSFRRVPDTFTGS